MTTAIYARLSRAANDDELAVRRQQRDCLALAEREKWDVAGVYVDNDFSAFTGKQRPEYQRMLDDLKAGLITRVVAWHPDRLHRSPRELEDFVDLVEATGADVATVTAGAWNLSTPEDRCMARIVGAIARKESEDKSRRLQRKHAELAERGHVHGGGVRPYGYRRVKDAAGRIVREEIVPEEAAVIREAMDRFLAGESIRSICVDLNRRSIPASTGGQWNQASLRGILRSGRISGQRQHRGQIIAKADWPAIVPPAKTMQARAIIDDPSRRQTRAPREYLLSRLVRCSRCGATMISRCRPNGTRLYACVSGPAMPGCGRMVTVAEPLEQLVVEAVLQALDSPELDRRLRAGPTDSEVAGDAQAQIDAARQQLEELAAAYGNNEITLPEWLAARRPIEARIDAAARLVASERRTSAIAGFVGKASTLRKRWASLDLSRRHAIVAAIVDHIEISPAAKPGHRPFDPDRVNIVWSG